MEHAYLIMAHNEFQLLEILLKLLDYPHNSIFVHIDKRVSIGDLNRFNLKYASLKIIQRINVFWGGMTQIECEMLLFDMAVKNSDAEYFHLLSGVDLPLKKQCDIHDFFRKNKGMEFISFDNFFPVNDRHILDRIGYYHLLPFGRRRFDVKFDKCIVSLQKFMEIKRNLNIDFYKGANWCSVTRKFVKMLLDNKCYIDEMFAYSFCADELYKQTLYMLNRDEYKLKLYLGGDNNESNNSMRKIDWRRGSPYVWTAADYDELMTSNCLFARKFSLNKDEKIIEKIKCAVVNE